MASHVMWVERRPAARQWLLSLGLVILGGLAWIVAGFGIAGGGLVAALFAVLPALTCLVAGRLLGSWFGFIATAGVYVAASAVMWVLAVGGGPAGMAFWSGEFALFVVLPGFLLAAVGTALGMYRSRHER